MASLPQIPKVVAKGRRVLVEAALLNELIATANSYRQLRVVGNGSFDISESNAVLQIGDVRSPGAAAGVRGDASISGHIEVPFNREYVIDLHTPAIVVSDVFCSLAQTGVVSTSDASTKPVHVLFAAVDRATGDEIAIAAGEVTGDIAALRPAGAVPIPAGSRLFLRITSGGCTSAPVWSTTASNWVQATGSVAGGDYAEAAIALDLSFTIKATLAS